MPWKSSNRRSRFNKGWARIRRIVLERDHYQCQWPVCDEHGFPAGKCLAPARAVDHKLHNMVRDDDSQGNLWALCDYHHNLKTQVEAAEGKRRRARRGREAAFFDQPAFR